MDRLAFIVVPGLPHHVTQRGNRRGTTFFEDGDYALYLDLLAEASARARTEVWAYCLMPNHVHIILVPSDEDGLRQTFADLHRRYTGYIDARARTTGHLCLMSLDGPVRIGGDGRSAPLRRSALRDPQSRPREACPAGTRLGLVERPCASGGQGR
jgi:putative transposase